MEGNKEIAARFTAIRKEIGAKQKDLSKVLGISRGMISLLESGSAKLTERNIKAVCKAYNINENWLKTGQGPMYTAPSSQSLLENDEETELIRMFRRLTAETKRIVVEIVRKFASSEENTAVVDDNSLEKKQSPLENTRKGA